MSLNKPDQIHCRTFDSSPSKRWEASRRFADQVDQPPPRTADNWIKRCVRFLRASKTDSVAQEMWASRYWKDIYGAVAIYMNEGVTDRRKRILECGILAKKDNEFIAKELCVTKDVVDAYEALFYDVRATLDNRSIVCGSVLSRFMEYGDKDTMFYALAYFFGWETFYSYSIGGATAEVDAWIRVMTNRNNRINALTVSSTLDPSNPLNAEVIYNITTHMDEMEEKDKDRRLAGGVALGETKDSVQVLLNSAPTNIMQTKELRADEARVLPGAVSDTYVEAKKPEPIEHGKAKQG